MNKSLDDVLAHYGVKGMKWGVRRDDTKSPKTKNQTESMSATTSKGEKLELRGDKVGPLAKIAGALFPPMRKLINESSNYTLFDEQGKKVGEMALREKNGDELNVVWVGVNPKAQGRGLATSAMRSAIDLAKQKKLDKVTLEVPGRSPDARHIYEKLGFKETEIISTPENDPMWGGLTGMELKLQHGADLNDILAHYGIKGMKWGVRRDNPSGSKPAASGDHETAKAAKAKVKAGGLKSLSNEELKTYLERMDLEKRYKKGNPGIKEETGKFIKDILIQIGKEETKKYAAKQVAKALAGRA
ncbi:acetyltransferase [Streptomyces phage Bilo]|nr:acetyltransferase [Streptomyces phage Bilo]